MKPYTIALFGYRGRFGRWFANFFLHRGCEVFGIESETPSSVVWSSVRAADIVLFATPTEVTVRLIKDFDQEHIGRKLILETASTKNKIHEALSLTQLLSRNDVVGFHVLCGPVFDPKEKQPLKGQRIVRCDSSLGVTWKKWCDEFFSELGGITVSISARDHDWITSSTQVEVHTLLLLMVLNMYRLDIDIKESLLLSTPPYRFLLSLAGRMLSQDPSLYFEIQKHNSFARSMRTQITTECSRLFRILDTGDWENFEHEWSQARKHIGGSVLDGSLSLSRNLIQFEADIETTSLKVGILNDHPGLLHRITSFFVEENVNLAAFHTGKDNSGHITFFFVFEQITEEKRRRVVKKIEKMSEVKVLL